MSREIKFRGKRIVDGDWFYGNLITEVDGDFNIKNAYIHVRLSEVHFSENSLISNLCLHEIDPETVGQYTGLKEIYEGDLYRTADGSDTGIIKYRGAGFYIDWLPPVTFGLRSDLYYVDDGEIIGNIHENGDLISVSNDRSNY